MNGQCQELQLPPQPGCPANQKTRGSALQYWPRARWTISHQLMSRCMAALSAVAAVACAGDGTEFDLEVARRKQAKLAEPGRSGSFLDPAMPRRVNSRRSLASGFHPRPGRSLCPGCPNGEPWTPPESKGSRAWDSKRRAALEAFAHRVTPTAPCRAGFPIHGNGCVRYGDAPGSSSKGKPRLASGPGPARRCLRHGH